MEIAGLLSGSDNLFKYLFTLGTFMVVISIAYPLQKKHELQIEINIVNKETGLLNKEIEILNKKVDLLKIRSKELVLTIDGLKSDYKIASPSKKPLIKNQIETIRSEYNKSFDNIESEKQKIEMSSIVLDFSKSRVLVIKEQSGTYQSIFIILLIIGCVLSIIGIVFWTLSTIRSEKLKAHETKKALEVN